ncbi:TetR/AcrR family transcriptional regulator [Nostoc sp. 3335mG]|nr:TetR/AcrR family transcriptional regulator [Nostoc sp. 3335mG]
MPAARPLPPPAPPASPSPIETALIALAAEGGRFNHDAVAKRAGVSRRTVYRRYPDQKALRAAIVARIEAPAPPPASLEAVIEGLAARFTEFDARPAEATLALASTEGRAARRRAKGDEVRAMLGEAAGSLPDPERARAAAMLGFLSEGTAWLELREQWDLTGDDAAAACRWALETLIEDLRRRGG